MTSDTCMALVDTLAPNGVEASVKLRWLCELEGRIRVELKHQPPAELSLEIGSDLSVPYPFDQLYWMYLVAMIDFINHDCSRYENSAAMFNMAYRSYAKWLQREGGN